MGTKDQGEYRSPEEAAAAAKFNKDQMSSRDEAAGEPVVTLEMYDEAHHILGVKPDVADTMPPIDFEWAEAVSDVYNDRRALERLAKNEGHEEANSLARMVEKKKKRTRQRRKKIRGCKQIEKKITKNVN